MNLDEFKVIVNSYNFFKYGFSKSIFSEENKKSVINDQIHNTSVAIFSNRFISMEIRSYVNGVHISFAKSEMQHFGLRDYLVAKNMRTVEQMNNFTFALNYKTTEEMLRAHLDLLVQTIEGHLLELISGEKWEDIPFDWSIAGR